MDDRERWNAKWERRADRPLPAPSPFVAEALRDLPNEGQALLPREGRSPRPPREGQALDIACGAGRHALPLAEHGLHVLGVDVSEVALESLAAEAQRRRLPVRTLRRDLARDGLDAAWREAFDVVLCVHWLERPVLRDLPGLLAPGGSLLVQTFSLEHHRRTGFRQEWCLAPGELDEIVEGLDVIRRHRGPLDGRDEEAVLARRRA